MTTRSRDLASIEEAVIGETLGEILGEVRRGYEAAIARLREEFEVKLRIADEIIRKSSDIIDLPDWKKSNAA